jgi:hypothetical protein
MLALACHPIANSHDLTKAATLVGLLPPKQTVWSLRMRQYIVRLSHAWRQASQADHIVVFDQGFVQAVFSLVSFHGREPDEALIAQALDHIPKPDLLIRLDAPRETLKARLCDRVRRQSRIERLFELHEDTNLGSLHLIDLVHELLRKRGQSVMRVASLDQGSLDDSVRDVGRQINSDIGCPAERSSGGTTDRHESSHWGLSNPISPEDRADIWSASRTYTPATNKRGH